MSAGPTPVVTRHGRLDPDRSRVIARLFVPGQEGFDQEDSRTGAVLARVLALDDADVDAAIADVVERFGGRHRDLLGVFDRHAVDLADRLDPARALSDSRRLLLGAAFTAEYALEGAALCNPSMVSHPDQSNVERGHVRFVMSVRCIGEGHRSSIGFRTGTVDPSGRPTFDARTPFATAGTTVAAPVDASRLHRQVQQLGGSGDTAEHVLATLRPRFTRPEVEERIRERREHASARRRVEHTITLIETIADRSYGIEFDTATELCERILLPSMDAESHGMEDARFVRFAGAASDEGYYATYTAYDGSQIRQQILKTQDFRTFTSMPIVGAAAANKGLALFPRRVGGRFAALSRCDRETNSIAFSDDLHDWPEPVPCQRPTQSWEVLQLGNCGSPIETEAGWLVLTHGVGPMRTYSIGAILLDLDDPTVVVGKLDDALLTPTADERDGYVPNVAYSCGALVAGETLVIPYGICDSSIGVASVAMPELLDALTSG